MGEACSTYSGEENGIQGFVGEAWSKETTWKTGTDERMILKRILMNGMGGRRRD
jgi:hypothetical protein